MYELCQTQTLSKSICIDLQLNKLFSHSQGKISKFSFCTSSLPLPELHFGYFLKIFLNITRFECILICEQNFKTFLKFKVYNHHYVIIYLILPKLLKPPEIFCEKNKKAIYHCKWNSIQSSTMFLIFWEYTCFSSKMTVWKHFQSKCC